MGDNEVVDSEYRDYYIESLAVLCFSLDLNLLNGHFYQVYYSIGLFSFYDF